MATKEILEVLFGEGVLDEIKNDDEFMKSKDAIIDADTIKILEVLFGELEPACFHKPDETKD